MIQHKIIEWIKRYILAETVGTITALVAASTLHIFYDNPVYIAYAGSMGEAVGFYLTVFIQKLFVVFRKRKLENSSFTLFDFRKIIIGIILEFGPAGLVDGLVLRPFFMVLFPFVLNDFMLGILVGKFAGDITFYLLVILSYEINKRRKINQI